MFQYSELPSFISFSVHPTRLVMFASTRAKDYAFYIKLKKTFFLVAASQTVTGQNRIHDCLAL